MSSREQHFLIARLRPVFAALKRHGITRAEVKTTIHRPCGNTILWFRHRHAVVWLKIDGFDGLIWHSYRRMRGVHGLPPIRKDRGWAFGDVSGSTIDRIITELS